MAGKFIKSIYASDGRQHDLYSQTVEVLKHDKQMQTSVHGSGGGGSTFQGYGNTSNVKISSITTPHDYLTVKQDDGTETSIHVIFFDLLSNVGHKLTLVSAREKNSNEEQYVAIFNNNTNQTFFNRYSVGKMYLGYDGLQRKAQGIISFMPGIVKFILKTFLKINTEFPGAKESQVFINSFYAQEYK